MSQGNVLFLGKGSPGGGEQEVGMIEFAATVSKNYGNICYGVPTGQRQPNRNGAI